MSAELATMDDYASAALDSLDTPSREIAISDMLDRAKQYMEVALQQSNAPQLMADFKAEIIAVAQYAKQKRVSEEIQIDATSMVRRAERSLGVAIREGQDAGTVANPSTAARQRELRKGTDTLNIPVLPSPKDFAPPHELFGAKPGNGLYAMTDGVTDAEFEAALDAAKAEGKPNRANVVRKIKEAKGEPVPEHSTQFQPLPDETRERVQELASQGMSSREIGAQLGIGKSTVNATLKKGSPANNKTAQTMERLTSSLWGVRQSLQTITAVDAGLDPEQVAAWIKELTKTSQELNRIKNLLKESI